jgi:hypothetical protein
MGLVAGLSSPSFLASLPRLEWLNVLSWLVSFIVCVTSLRRPFWIRRNTVPVFRYHCSTIPDTVEVSVRYQRFYGSDDSTVLTDSNEDWDALLVEAINVVTSNVG